MDKPMYNAKPAISILRIFDEKLAKSFYLDFLSFKLDWEHRFEPSFPLYMQVSLGSCILHLSEHHGDCTPGGAIRIELDKLENYHQQLLDTSYYYARPGIEQTPWGTKEVQVIDPFGNRIIMYEANK